MSKLLNTKEFAAPFIAAGVFPPNVRRVIIDAEAGGLVKVYFDTFASPTLMQIVTPELLMNAEKIVHSEANDVECGSDWDIPACECEDRE